MSLLANSATAAPAAEIERYRAEFQRLAPGRNGEPAWLDERRRSALERFESLGFPTTRQEDWRFTSVAPIARTAFQPAPVGDGARVRAADLASLTFGQAFDGHQIVVVNGRHAPELSSVRAEDGVEVRSLRELLADQPEWIEPHLGRTAHDPVNPFAALNTALFEDGVVVRVRPGLALSAPIHVVFFTRTPGGEPAVSHPRLLLVAGRASQLTLVESYGGDDAPAYFTNAVTEVVAEDGSVVDHYKVQREGAQAFHVGAMGVVQGRSASFTSHSIALGGALVRNDVNQVFAGEGGECFLGGLFMADGTQHTDTHTRIDHAVPHCSSRELYKGILDGRAHGVFVGRILVRKGALKTDAQQVNKNLLLSREALVDSLPQLEILADDVKCKHGSTTGQLDPAALFYLRSRGIPEAAARSLLVYAFAGDLVGRVKVETLRAGLEEYLQSRLPTPLDGDTREAVL